MMTTRFLAILATLLPMGAALAGPQVAVTKASEDLGAVWVGDSTPRQVEFQNTGDADLVIQSATAGQRLLVQGQFPLKVAPGATGTVAFTLRDNVTRGRFAENLTLNTNDPQRPRFTIPVTGELKWVLEPTTATPQLGRVAPGDVGQSAVMLYNRSDAPVRVGLAQPQSGAYRGTLIETIAGREFKLLIDLQAGDQSGAVRGDLVLQTNIPSQPQIHIQPIATVPKTVDITPATYVLDQRAPLAEALKYATQYDVTVRFFGERPGKVTAAACDDTRARVDVVESIPGRLYRAIVNLPAEFAPTRPVTLRIETDHPDRPIAVVGLMTKELARLWRPAASLEGQTAPQFDLQTTQGRLSTSDLANQPATVLDFVAPDCGFCSRQLPEVDQARQELEAHGVRFIAVSQHMGRDFTDTEALQHYGELAPELEVLLNHSNSLGEKFLVTSYPSLFVLDGKGVVRDVLLGAQQDMAKVLRERVGRILNP